MFNLFRKRTKSEVIRDNVRKGRAAEENVRTRYEMDGYKVKRTGIGHDFKVSKTNIFTGKKTTKYIEVKSGKAKLSRLQKRTKRKSKNYVVERDEPLFW